MRLVFLLALAAAACHPTAPTPVNLTGEDCSALAGYAPTDARRDASKAWRSGDRRLIGIYAYAREVPGVEHPTLPVRMIEGTSDSGCTTDNERVRAYAAGYNAEISRLAR